MKNIYSCPHCDQCSTRRWNLEIHIKRRHQGVGLAVRHMMHGPRELSGKQSGKNWRADFSYSESSNNIFSPSLETQRFILESARNMKELTDLCSHFYGQQAPGLINATQNMNLGFSNRDTTLGFKGYVCEKCLTLEIAHIFNDAKSITQRPSHLCKPQRLSEAQSMADIQERLTK